SFHLVPEATSDLTIDGVPILAPATSPNTDGIDPGGANINISNRYLDTGDENIAIKAGGGTHPDGVPARHCRFFHGHPLWLGRACTLLHGHGLSMGSELNAGVENFAAQNITFDGTDNGLRIKSDRTRGGLVRNVSYGSISIRPVGPIINLAGYSPESPIPPR